MFQQSNGLGDNWWDAASAGAGSNYYDPIYDTVITTNSYAQNPNTQQAQAFAIAAAAVAAANAALMMAEQTGNPEFTAAFAREAARDAWRGATGSVEGYQAYEPSIMDRAAYSIVNATTWAGRAAKEALTSASTAAGSAARTAGSAALPFTLGAGFGAGTLLLAGGGLLLLLLLKK